jgi:hypothetical protein
MKIVVTKCGYGCPFAAVGDMDGVWCSLAFYRDDHIDIPHDAPPSDCPLRAGLVSVELAKSQNFPKDQP